MDWEGQTVLVTDGASFISSHLIDRLVENGARGIRPWGMPGWSR